MENILSIDRYEIFLEFSGYEYQGVEKIKVQSKSDIVQLDSKGLKIHEVIVDGISSKFEVKNDKLIVYSRIKENLEIKFQGKASEKSLVGIYVTPYNKKYLINTQFSPVYARRFIPCFDVPFLKAVFKLTIKVDKDIKVISNMPIVSTKQSEGKIVYEFQETPRMSTYLLYLGIGDFEEIYDEERSPKIIVATIPGKSKRGTYALSLARMLLDFYEKYFDISYPLPKLHLIAVPELAVRAMENWGAITFREDSLLISESSPILQRFSVSSVMAHEFAHNWFGNLVTMKEWSDLWLKESFATFMSYKALKKLFPRPELNEWEFQRHVLNALFLDSLSDTHPIQTSVKDPSEIEQIFDAISYDKGAAILRMIEDYVGEDKFRRGVIEYLNTHKFGNAEGKDFWNSISKVAGNEVRDIIADWVSKPGYPLINVKVEGNKIELSQRRFTISGLQENVIYKVPLTYEINGVPGRLFMDKEETTLSFSQGIFSLKINLNRNGFYRVIYIPLELVFSARLNPYEEVGLINDYWNFVLAGLIDMKTYLNTLMKFNSRNPFLSAEINSELLTLYAINKEKYYNVIRDILLTQTKLYKDSKDEVETNIYYSLLKSLAIIDETFALDLAKMFKDYDKLNEETKESVAIAYAVSTGDFEGLLSKYVNLEDENEKSKILSALTLVRDKGVTQKLISLIVKRAIKLQEVVRVINGLARNPFTRDEICNYLKGNFDEVKEILVTTMGKGWGLVPIIREAIVMCGVDKPEETIEFLDNIKYKEIERQINNAKEIIRAYRRIRDVEI